MENREYLQELSSQATSLGLSFDVSSSDSTPLAKDVSVLFVPSFSESQRTYLLDVSEMLVYTPSFEHFGIVPIEGMYARLPVIAVNNGGPTESILDGITGYLADPDPSSFSSAMLKVLQLAPAKRLEMGKAGRERVLAHFSVSKFVQELLAVLRVVQGKKVQERSLGWIWLGVLLLLLGVLLNRF